jgi:hypothetical protein
MRGLLSAMNLAVEADFVLQVALQAAQPPKSFASNLKTTFTTDFTPSTDT